MTFFSGTDEGDTTVVAKRLSIHPHSDKELRAIESKDGIDPFVARTIHLGDESSDAAPNKIHQSVLVCDVTLHSPSQCRISNAADQMKYVDMLRWAPLVPALYRALRDLRDAVPDDDMRSDLRDAMTAATGIIADMIAQDDQNTLP